MSNQTTRARRSEKMLPEERTAFSEKVREFDTIVDACEFFELSRVTIDKLLYKGSGKSSTIALIRKKLGIATA